MGKFTMILMPLVPVLTGVVKLVTITGRKW